MQTVHPSIMLGSFLWDEERLPRDEFDIRLASIKDAIKQNGWAGAIVYGDAREHANLAWYSNFIPRMRWAMALYSASGDQRLLASMSSRDIPAMRTMTMIENVKSGWEWKWFDEWAATLGDGGVIGVINLDQITTLLIDAMDKSFDGKFKLVNADAIAAQARASQRPREIAVIREAAAIAAAARQAFVDAWDSGQDIEHCALAAERTAREQSAHDIRTLVSRDNGRTLQPYSARFDDRPGHLLGYVAVKYLGYWADTFVHAGTPDPLQAAAQSALDAALGALTDGADLSDIAQAASAGLGSFSAHPALSGDFGGRIGLSLREGDTIMPGAAGQSGRSIAYSLRAGVLDADAGGAIASALAVKRADGRLEILLSSGGV